MINEDECFRIVLMSSILSRFRFEIWLINLKICMRMILFIVSIIVEI